jgi:hypothetical protein
MIEVEDLHLTDQDRDFLQKWADLLKISVPELLGRIIVADLEGERYVEMMPTD